MSAKAPRPMPPERVMVPLLLVAAAVAAVGLAIPCLLFSSPRAGEGWLPWAFVAMGVAGLAVAIFERRPAIDLKASVKANALVVLFGPIGARVGYALIGGAFLGAGIGLLFA